MSVPPWRMHAVTRQIFERNKANTRRTECTNSVLVIDANNVHGSKLPVVVLVVVFTCTKSDAENWLMMPWNASQESVRAYMFARANQTNNTFAFLSAWERTDCQQRWSNTHSSFLRETKMKLAPKLFKTKIAYWLTCCIPKKNSSVSSLVRFSISIFNLLF